jgi:hypothetical protein
MQVVPVCPRLEFNGTKTFEFRHVQEAYLAITVKGAEGSQVSQTEDTGEAKQC